MPSLSLLLLLSLISLSSAHSTTLSLSPAAALPAANQWERLRHLAAASAARAYHLKYPASTASPLGRMQVASSDDKIPLYPRGYGGYSVTLPLGTPPQPLSFVMDTGSSLVWAPCTDRYSCSSCNFQGVSNVSHFIPRSSSSSMIIGCRNPKCRWIFPNVQCKNCSSNSSSCAEFCPSYIIEYGSGSTTGLLLSESLNLPEKVVKNFVFGCSVYSSRLPEGIAGFGRGPESLPAQMGLKRFSYCLLSHRFDDEPVSTDLVLESGGRSRKRGTNSTSPAGAATAYTPFRQNRTPANPAFTNYYYVTLRKITVGGVKIKAPYHFLVPDSAGNGGTIIDSGTTFTAMENSVYDLVAQEFEKQVGKTYSRAREIERLSGLRPCFNVSGLETITLPQLAFQFKGGAEMELPLGDYFSFVDDSVVCMTIVSSGPAKGGIGPGPAIILGNYQQQNYYVEYDLEKERLGFRKQLCK